MSSSPRCAPALVASHTEDDESIHTKTDNVDRVDRKAIAYLLRYETMVRQQETEHMATLAHLRPLLDTISSSSTLGLELEDVDLQQEISYAALQQALRELEDSSHSYMQTDRQLVMVLQTLTQKLAMFLEEEDEEESTITWAEFLQCYKTVISGMQTLQHVKQGPRARVKDRTLSMISLFEPPATKLLNETSIPKTVDIPMTCKSASSGKWKTALLGIVVGAALAMAVSVSSPTVWSDLQTQITGTPPPTLPLVDNNKKDLQVKKHQRSLIENHHQVKKQQRAAVVVKEQVATATSPAVNAWITSGVLETTTDLLKKEATILETPKPIASTVNTPRPTGAAAVVTKSATVNNEVFVQTNHTPLRQTALMAAGGIVGIALWQAATVWFPAGRVLTLVAGSTLAVVGGAIHAHGFDKYHHDE